MLYREYKAKTLWKTYQARAILLAPLETKARSDNAIVSAVFAELDTIIAETSPYDDESNDRKALLLAAVDAYKEGRYTVGNNLQVHAIRGMRPESHNIVLNEAEKTAKTIDGDAVAYHKALFVFQVELATDCMESSISMAKGIASDQVEKQRLEMGEESKPMLQAIRDVMRASQERTGR